MPRATNTNSTLLPCNKFLRSFLPFHLKHYLNVLSSEMRGKGTLPNIHDVATWRIKAINNGKLLGLETNLPSPKQSDFNSILIWDKWRRRPHSESWWNQVLTTRLTSITCNSFKWIIKESANRFSEIVCHFLFFYLFFAEKQSKYLKLPVCHILNDKKLFAYNF